MKYLDAPLLDPAAPKQVGVSLKAANDTLRKTAPAELAADVTTVTATSDVLAGAFATGRSPTPAELAALRAPTYQAASRRIAAYAKDRCGLG